MIYFTALNIEMSMRHTGNRNWHICFPPIWLLQQLDVMWLSVCVSLTVIPDTLQISFTRSLTGQPVPEGAELTLTCSSSIRSEQLTHLSIMFGKRGGAEAPGGGAGGGEVSTVREIISIDNLLGIVPGRSYKKRYDDGEITLEKRNGAGGQDVYLMKMRAVQPDDTGSYFCEATQWIRDADRSWQKIAQRTLDIGNLTVQQIGQCDMETGPGFVCANVSPSRSRSDWNKHIAEQLIVWCGGHCSGKWHKMKYGEVEERGCGVIQSAAVVTE